MRVSYVAEVTFDFPEARYLRAVVKPKCDADLPFSIDNAQWELYYRDDDGERYWKTLANARSVRMSVSIYPAAKDRNIQIQVHL